MTNNSVPYGFVYLSDFDPRIKFDMRYSGSNNIFGRQIKHYETNVPICTYQAALAIKKAQDEFEKSGYCLVIYDAYRPLGACKDMVDWIDEDSVALEGYYVDFDSKIALFHNDYISDKSSHCRGSTLDMSILHCNTELKSPVLSYREINNRNIPWMDDNTLDMGTSFDYMGVESHTNYPHLNQTQIDNRKSLVSTLEKYGLMNHAVSWEDEAQEWWHFTLKDEPFPDTYFDFPVR